MQSNGCFWLRDDLATAVATPDMLCTEVLTHLKSKSIRFWYSTMFEKNLLDLVKGIRSHKGNEAQFISDCIREIKSELTKADPDLKAEALNKLTYVRPFPTISV